MTEQNLQIQDANNQDALKECVRFALSIYGIHANIGVLLAETAREGGALQPADILKLSDHLNIKAEIKERPLKALHKLDIPCIVLLKDRKAQVFLPQKTHKNKTYIPGSGIAEKDIKTLKESYSGHVILLTPRQSAHATPDKTRRKMDWVWRPIQEHWDSYAEVLVTSFFINLFALALPLFTMNVYDRVVPNFAVDTLIVLTVGIVIALSLDFLFKTIRSFILETLSSRIGTGFDFELMERLLSVRATAMPFTIGEQANLFKEIQSLRDFYATKLAPSFVDFPFFLLFLFVIAQISPALVIVPVVAAVVILAINLLVHIPIKKLTKRYFEDLQHKSSLLIENLTGAETLKMFNALGHSLFKWNVASAQSASSAKNAQFLTGWAQNASVTVMHMTNVFVIVLGVYEINAGNLTIGGLIAATILSARAVGPVMAVAGTFSSMKHARDVMDTISQVYALPHEGTREKQQTDTGQLNGQITFRDVSYFYPGQPVPALKDVSFTIKPGEKVGIIGKTGAGKSTIARLISGFVKPESGSILLDNFAIDAIHPVELRDNMSIVPQKSFFFKGTLKNNVIMGNENVSDEDFKRAVQISGLDLYIQQSAQGFDVDIGENGNKLSGGQQQAVALARALLRDPRIVIMDEPTNGMDYVLEARIKDTLKGYLGNRTLVLITHRTSLLPLVDRLILIDQGKVVADGPRDDVLKKLGGSTKGAPTPPPTGSIQ